MNSRNGVWGEGYLVFLSYESHASADAAKLKAGLEFYGITAFLAHEDIDPTKLWEEEINRALETMNAFVPLLTPEFHDSKWADHEIGYAICRGVPIVPVRLGLDPYGFIGRLQAIRSGWDEAPLEIVNILVSKDPAMTEAYIDRVLRCENFNDGNRLAKILESITELTDNQVEKLLMAFNQNTEVSGSYGFNGQRSNHYGEGLAKHLQRLTGKEYYCHTNGSPFLDDLPF